MAPRALVERIRGQPLRDPKPHLSRPILRRCRELLMAPRALLGKIRDKPQSFVIGMCVCNPALQFLSCPGGLTKWIHEISWRFGRIMHSRMRRRLPQQPAQFPRHGWRTLSSNHVFRVPWELGRGPTGIGSEALGTHQAGARARPAQMVSEGALVSELLQARAKPPLCLPTDRQGFYRITGAWPLWVRRIWGLGERCSDWIGVHPKRLTTSLRRSLHRPMFAQSVSPGGATSVSPRGSRTS